MTLEVKGVVVVMVAAVVTMEVMVVLIGCGVVRSRVSWVPTSSPTRILTD